MSETERETTMTAKPARPTNKTAGKPARSEAERQDDLVTTLYRATDALLSPIRSAEPPSNLEHARTADFDEMHLPTDFTDLARIVTDIDALMHRDTRLSTQVNGMREAFGDGETLKILFQRLFPNQLAPPVRQEGSPPFLSERELEILKEVAQDLSYLEIGKKLGISSRTVGTHMNRIYEKVGVNRPMQAVARAIAFGWLEMDAIQYLWGAAKFAPRAYTTFNHELYGCNRVDSAPQSASLQALAEFGLLLLLLAGRQANALHADALYAALPSVQISRIDRASGEVKTSFRSEHLRGLCGIAAAPRHAERAGFRSGHLYITHRLPPFQGDAGVMSEFSQTGMLVRTFTGGPNSRHRIHGVTNPVFLPDGRLLLPSGGGCSGLLTFSEGGSTVERVASIQAIQAALGPEGKLYGAAFSPSWGGSVHVFNPALEPIHRFGITDPGVDYAGIAVTSRGESWLLRRTYLSDDSHYALDFRDPAGDLVRTVPLAGLHRALLAIDSRDQLYVPCPRTGDVKVLAPSGALVAKIPVPGGNPYAVAIAPGGDLWVSSVPT